MTVSSRALTGSAGQALMSTHGACVAECMLTLTGAFTTLPAVNRKWALRLGSCSNARVESTEDQLSQWPKRLKTTFLCMVSAFVLCEPPLQVVDGLQERNFEEYILFSFYI